MPHTRTALVLALCLVLTLIWQAWEKDYGRLRAPLETTNETQPGQAPVVNAATETPAPAALPEAAAAPASATTTEAATIAVETDTVRATVSLRGGELSGLLLKDYPVAVDKPDEPLAFLDNSDALTFVAQGGLLSETTAPTHQEIYAAAQRRYQLDTGADTVEVPLTWQSPEGLQVTKTYVFHRGSHVIDLRYDIRNTSATAWTGRAYAQLLRRAEKPKRGLMSMPTYIGAAISSPEKRYEKLPFDEMGSTPLDRTITGGWAAMLQHYFVAALVPPANEPFQYYTKALDQHRYIVGMYGPQQQVEPGQSISLTSTIYAGPKDQDRLEQLAPGLDLTVDYGSLWFLSKPLFWWMQKLHAWTGNWGWAIILLTLTVKAALYRLAAASYRSMAHMKQVQPRLVALRERYANDKQRLNQAMMELYKQEKINPLGGCLPVLVQIPVFLALYWVLLESVELRQAPFIGWIKDLSTYDPYFVLPVLMGISMFVQQRMNPAPPDPVQAKVMQILPVVFTVFFIFFPAGLVLYWLVNNVLSIAQQWLITRSIEGAKAKT
jgi:YidC/Oxa1 family membrane protein insertase